MPQRYINESIRTSKTVNAMTDFQFRMWVYLITYVDNHGRGSADPELIKGAVFPRRPRLTKSDIEKTLAELAGMGCISLYDVDGKSYFYFPNWGKHQRIRGKSEYPAPEYENTRQVAAGRGELPQQENPYKDCTIPKIPKISKIAQNALPAFEQPASIPTQLDFQRFSEIAATAYPEGCQYTLGQCLEVFRCYFQTYEDYRGHPHSPLRPAQITRIMEEMPCIVIEDRGGHLEPLAPEDYVDLIDLHFRTPYRNCDYNINHFFSGRIREILLYDAERDFE